MPVNTAEALRLLPDLAGWLEKIRRSSRSGLSGVQVSEDDHFAVMALCFQGKQVEHSLALEALVPRKDSILIARTMVEGMCQLLWAARDMPERAQRWREFALVEDFREWKRRLKKGQAPSPEKEKELDQRLAEASPLLLKKQNKPVQGQTRASADPFHPNWRAGRSIADIFKEVEGDDLHEFLYGPYSSWAHWGPSAFSDRFRRSEGRIGYDFSEGSPVFAAQAMVVGFQALYQTTFVAALHLGLGYAREVEAIRDRFVKWHKGWAFPPQSDLGGTRS